ncbi:NAD(P)-binding domain-containing protein [Kribbella sp. VKM Ac-2571]|uniref:NAD(P)-binding domain-containing protein n=1 Tax=Kribbella sp. VKM Ac-2571 TaxID=2512222 RepID=UPI00105FE978
MVSLVNHGTGLPQAAQTLADLAKPYGVAVLDAPVSGGHAVALARQLTTIVGGDKDVVERLEPDRQRPPPTAVRTHRHATVQPRCRAPR